MYICIYIYIYRERDRYITISYVAITLLESHTTDAGGRLKLKENTGVTTTPKCYDLTNTPIRVSL